MNHSRQRPWVKLYRDEAGSFAQLSFVTRAIAGQLLKATDDRGRIFAGRREPWEAIAFTMGADRGDRRAIRKAVIELLADGYLRSDGEWLQVANFGRFQGSESDAIVHRSDNDRATTERERATTEQRPSNEDQPKLSKSLERENENALARPRVSVSSLSSSHLLPKLPDAREALPLVDPEPPPHPTAPIDVRVRSALVRGYREAFEGRHRTMPTDVVSGALDAAIAAVLHRADVTNRDPLELAANVGPMWISTRTSPRIPRWEWFVEGIGEILAAARAAAPPTDEDWGEPIDVLGMLGGAS